MKTLHPFLALPLMHCHYWQRMRERDREQRERNIFGRERKRNDQIEEEPRGHPTE
jgi:hypothetical protein